jgi:hypothetical protein
VLGAGLEVSALRENSSEKRDVSWWEKFANRRGRIANWWGGNEDRRGKSANRRARIANRREKSQQGPSSADDGAPVGSLELERWWGQLFQGMELSPVGLWELERSWGRMLQGMELSPVSLWELERSWGRMLQGAELSPERRSDKAPQTLRTLCSHLYPPVPVEDNPFSYS